MFSNPFSLSPIRMITDGCGYNGADCKTMGGRDWINPINLDYMCECQRLHSYVRSQFLAFQGKHPNRGEGGEALAQYQKGLNDLKHRLLTQKEAQSLGLFHTKKAFCSLDNNFGMFVHEHKDNGVRLNVLNPKNLKSMASFPRQTTLVQCTPENQWGIGRIINTAQRRCHTWSTLRQGSLVGLLGLGVLIGLRRVPFNWKSGLAGGALGLAWWAARRQHESYAKIAGFMAASSVYNGEFQDNAAANEHLNELDDASALQVFNEWRPRSTGGTSAQEGQRARALTFSESITAHKIRFQGGSRYETV